MLFFIVGTYEFDEIFIKDALTIKYLNEIDATSVIPLKSSQSIDYLAFGEATATKDIPVTESVNGYSNLMDEFEITVMVTNINLIHYILRNWHLLLIVF